MKKNLFIAILIFLLTLLSADNAEKKRLGQVTFFYPLGTGTTNSMEYSNSISFNMIFGMNGGVDAFELGGVGNYNSHDVNGFQLGGVFNINREETHGVQIAGISNTNFGDTEGLMLSTVNIATKEMRGFQIGVLNFAQKTKGIQLGLINIIMKGKESIPIGIFNFVKDGYFALEVSAGDLLYGNLKYKMGVERFYTIFNIGASVLKNKTTANLNFIFSYGLGWGTLIPLNDRISLAVEATVNQFLNDWKWVGGVNILNKIDLNCQIALNKHLFLFIGPSLKVYVTSIKQGSEYGNIPVPYTFYKAVHETTQVSMWVGGNLGIIYRF